MLWTLKKILIERNSLVGYPDVEALASDRKRTYAGSINGSNITGELIKGLLL